MLIPFGILSAAAGAVGRISVAGYFVAGYNSASVAQKSATKLNFPSDTRSTITDALTDPAIHLAGFADSGVAGYAGGGQTPLTRVNKLTFPAETLSILGTGLSANSFYGAAFANSGTAGYQILGSSSGGTDFQSTVDKFAFPSDSRTTLGTGLSGARGFLAAMANFGVAGYSLGGRIQPFAYITTVDKFAFPSDTRSTLGTGLSANNGTQAGYADAGVAGYSAGGVRGTGIDKFAFPSDTRSTLAAVMSTSNIWVSGVADSGVAGYAGNAGLGTPSSSVDKLAFPTDTKTTLSSIITHADQGHGSSFSNEGVF